MVLFKGRQNLKKKKKNEENEFFEIKHQKQFSKVENESNRDSMQLKMNKKHKICLKFKV